MMVLVSPLLNAHSFRQLILFVLTRVKLELNWGLRFGGTKLGSVI